MPSQWERRPERGEGESRTKIAAGICGTGERRHTQTHAQRERHRLECRRRGLGTRAGVEGTSLRDVAWSWSTLQSWGHDPLSLPLSDCNHGDEGAKGPALRPLIFSSPSLALSLPLTLAPCTGDFQACLASETPVGLTTHLSGPHCPSLPPSLSSWPALISSHGLFHSAGRLGPRARGPVDA